MDTWDGWPLQRFLYLFIAAAYLMVWAQLTLFHWRGAFRSRFMWGPVLYTPLLIAIAAFMGITRGDAIEVAYVIMFSIGAAEGLVGALLHARGVASYVGGFNLRNLMAGPPLILPLTYAALSGLALLVYYWEDIAGTAV